ncbi:MAG TPA: hypothetical protein VF221_19165, partial [Chloroflexota bacterium]
DTGVIRRRTNKGAQLENLTAEDAQAVAQVVSRGSDFQSADFVLSIFCSRHSWPWWWLDKRGREVGLSVAPQDPAAHVETDRFQTLTVYVTFDSTNLLVP